MSQAHWTLVLWIEMVHPAQPPVHPGVATVAAGWSFAQIWRLLRGALRSFWSPQHLLDFASMNFFGEDHLSGIFLKHHRFARHSVEERLIKRQRLALRSQSLTQYDIDVMFVAIQQWSDFQ